MPLDAKKGYSTKGMNLCLYQGSLPATICYTLRKINKPPRLDNDIKMCSCLPLFDGFRTPVLRISSYHSFVWRPSRDTSCAALLFATKS